MEAVGVKLIVGVPNYELYSYVDKKVKEYDFPCHPLVHGPDIKTYPDATDVWEHTKDLDPLWYMVSGCRMMTFAKRL